MAEQNQHLSYENVVKASYLLQDKVEKTPVYQCPRISKLVNEAVFQGLGDEAPQIELYLKCENEQNTNSKFRGATYFVSQLSDAILRRGVIAYSTGNHALSLASACKVASQEKGFSIPVVVVVPRGAPQTKVQQVRATGAKVISFGNTIADCLEMAQNIQRRAGMTLVPPIGHPDYVLGQGTVALEFLEQVQEDLSDLDEDDMDCSSDSSMSDASSDIDRPALDIMILPSAGSGLLAGAAIACQTSGVRVIAAEPESGIARVMGRAPINGAPAKTSNIKTLASDLCSVVAEHNWDAVRDSKSIDGVFGANEDDVKAALKPFMEESKMLIEPSGAIALAVLMRNTELHRKIAEMATYHRNSILRVGVVISGGNVTLDRLVEMFDAKAGVQRPPVTVSVPKVVPKVEARPIVPFTFQAPMLMPRLPLPVHMPQMIGRRQVCARF